MREEKREREEGGGGGGGGGEKERAPSSLYNLRRFIGQNSSSQEKKFIYSTRATCGYPKYPISPRIQAMSSTNQRFQV